MGLVTCISEQALGSTPASIRLHSVPVRENTSMSRFNSRFIDMHQEALRKDREIQVANSYKQHFIRLIIASLLDAGWSPVKIELKRVYEQPEASDGNRILVERLWPRGLTKEKAQVDLWMKDIAPTTRLRKWFNHDPGKWEEFQKRYRAELRENDEQVARLKDKIGKAKATFVYASEDEIHNAAIVLMDFLKG